MVPSTACRFLLQVGYALSWCSGDTLHPIREKRQPIFEIKEKKMKTLTADDRL